MSHPPWLLPNFALYLQLSLGLGVVPVIEPPGENSGSAGGGDACVESNKKFAGFRGKGNVSGPGIESRAAMVNVSSSVFLGHGSPWWPQNRPE